MSSAALPLVPPPALLVGLTLHLARGFGNVDKTPNPKKAAKAVRGKIVPCSACAGTGKKPCQFCEGTKMMVGFLGSRVPCVPCQATGTLGRACKQCGGMGYFTP